MQGLPFEPTAYLNLGHADLDLLAKQGAAFSWVSQIQKCRDESQIRGPIGLAGRNELFGLQGSKVNKSTITGAFVLRCKKW
jgi:hypothetical protein